MTRRSRAAWASARSAGHTAPAKPKRPDNRPNPYRSGIRDWKRSGVGVRSAWPAQRHQVTAVMASNDWGAKVGSNPFRGGGRLVLHRTRTNARPTGHLDRTLRTPAAEANRERNSKRKAARILAQHTKASR